MDHSPRRARPCGCILLVALVASAAAGRAGTDRAEPPASTAPATADPRARLRAELKAAPWKIVHETFRYGNWELFTINADGSNPVNLTRSPGVHELYPHAAPDGSKICFVVDAGQGKARSRNVYCMNADGSGRKLIARNARQSCFLPDGRAVAYMKGEFQRFTYKDFATKGLFIHDLAAGAAREHPNRSLHHLYNIGFTPCGRWMLATVHGGMGHRHANLAIEAGGKGVFNLKGVGGCRPDVRGDGRKVAWNASDQVIAVADLDLKASPPVVTNIRKAVTCDKSHEVYHADWSPDGRYIAFAHGPNAPEQVGKVATGWNICVADAARPNVWVAITADGASNKEPDWLPVATGKRR